MVELSNEKKKKIEALQSEEMAYEINLGRRSRFQREKFAYLQTCYQKRTEEEKLKNLISQNQSANKTPDISNEKHYPRESLIKKIAIGVVIIVLGSMTLWVLNHYFNLGLF